MARDSNRFGTIRAPGALLATPTDGAAPMNTPLTGVIARTYSQYFASV
jgi:hypothetical protein